eukprot:2516020-Rhodomonas_salina.2
MLNLGAGTGGLERVARAVGARQDGRAAGADRTHLPTHRRPRRHLQQVRRDAIACQGIPLSMAARVGARHVRRAVEVSSNARVHIALFNSRF